ncbi:IucA/IucC family protein [Bacillus methanolicus PB1]|uniref:IucA/IucC family protein n=1 Tax=Bacillus methanolicus PB1 TaxID=997296 RepID=I3DUX4_BACMT|nr:IucA/IucC family protein [Bacillus methanolicus]EIJ78045.1 IucA/IucC family protein [Bacillus methanolicus PB1]
MSTNITQLLEKDVHNKAYSPFHQVHMYNDEMKILNFLKSAQPHMAAEYVLSLAKGRQGILRRLAGSMLREDIMGLSSNSLDLYVIGSIYALNVPAIDEYWQRMIGVLNAYKIISGKVYKLYPLSGWECLVIPVSRTYAFNRVEVDGVILHISGSGVKTIEHAAELLELMRHKEEAWNEKGKNSWMKLEEELINGSANLALSYTYWNRKKKKLRQKAADQGITNLIDWVLFQKRQDRKFDSSLFFEQLCIEGHNLHPGTKTKIGMEPEDVFRYAPEFDGVTDIQFVGIRKDYAEWGVIEENEKDANAVLFNEYPDLPKAAEQEFTEYGLDMNDYVFVPVHSWQLEKAILDIYQQEIKEKIVAPIRGIVVPCGATSSFRTVVPLKNEETPKYAIKVAVNSQMTSTVRSISANTTNNAAVFSRLIRSVMQREQNLLETFVPIYECAGFNFKVKETEESKDHAHKLKSRNLSAVLRENVETFIAMDEVAVVCSSLFAESPISEKSVLKELIERYAEERKETSLHKAAFQFLSDYLSIALPGFLTLMVKYGIGLEGHLQNSVMVFKEGLPVQMLFRDWGGARIYQARLQQHLIDAQFYPGSITMTDQLAEMHNKVFYSVFQNHCGELILQVCKQFGLEEEELWKEVHRICDNVFKQLESLPPYSKNARIDKEALYQAKVNHKALTKMRLAPEGKDYFYAIVPNPLHEFGRKEG